MSVELVEYDRIFLDISWKWINDPEIRILISSPEITKEQQLEWFNNLKNLNNYYIWGVKINNIPAGVCGIKNIKDLKGEYWGYIGNKDFWGKGFGKEIMILVENEAKRLGLISLWLKVNDDNYRAIKLYEKMNYKIQKKDNKVIIMDKEL